MKLQYIKNVVTLQLDPEKCIGCGMCMEVCPHQVFQMEPNHKVRIRERDDCMECGACAKNCPAGAVMVVAGVGCAYGILLGKFRGTGPTCGCDDSEEESSCCG